MNLSVLLDADRSHYRLDSDSDSDRSAPGDATFDRQMWVPHYAPEPASRVSRYD
jgi:hypothetical protein